MSYLDSCLERFYSKRRSEKLIFIPDTQIRKGIPIFHIPAIARYIVEQKPDYIVIIGDWWDMPSLSVFNSKLQADGSRLRDDIDAGWLGMDLFLGPIRAEQQRIARNKKKAWNPKIIYTVGNHDPQVRIPRYLESNPVLEGWLRDDTSQRLTELGLEVYEFGQIAKVHDISFSHYFINPHSAKKSPAGGTIDSMLKNIGFSFFQGHTQTYKIGKHYLGDNTVRIGGVGGSCYLQDETYMGIQGNCHWRGIVQLNDIEKGGADILELSLRYLVREYGTAEDIKNLSSI